MKAMLIFLLTAAVSIISGAGPVAAQTNPVPADTEVKAATSLKKSNLIVYFSRTGNTGSVARQIQALAGGDLFEVMTVDPYPSEYSATTAVAKKEQGSDYRPPIRAGVDNMASYETIFIGYPNWWNTMPMAMFTFMEGHDFSGKTIVPFCTHEGSRLGRSVTDLARLAPGATILTGFEIEGSEAAEAAPRLRAWLEELNLLK